jgi:hypothetical protein
MNFRYGPSVPDYFSPQGNISVHMKGLVDKRCKTLSIVKHKLLFLSEEGFRVGVRLSVKGYGMDWAVVPFSNRDSGVFVVHVNAIEGSRILVIPTGDSELGKFKISVHGVFIP